MGYKLGKINNYLSVYMHAVVYRKLILTFGQNFSIALSARYGYEFTIITNTCDINSSLRHYKLQNVTVIMHCSKRSKSIVAFNIIILSSIMEINNKTSFKTFQ